ncbi:MAG: signal recognition particle protein, partial [Bowdeniella nasicola]|nr:signal recognition particle protein [Bowdeniella nasicola]
GGMPGMGNMPGMGKKSRGRQAPKRRRVKGKSGNPAKRRQQELEMERKLREKAEAAAKPKAKGSAFGLGSLGKQTTEQFEVPEGLEKFLKK